MTIVGTLRTYERAQFRPDLLAALTVTALLIPSGLAYGALAGLPPVAGLYTGCLGMVCYALLATSRVQIVGPESQMAILVASALAPIAAGSPTDYAVLAAALALVCALLCVLAGALRLGFLADYLSQPVLVGYLTGVALIIIVGQAAKLVGISADGDTLLELVMSAVSNLDGARLAPAVVGIVTIGLVLALRALWPRVPGSLVAVVVMTAASALLDLEGRGVAVVGDVPRGLPAPSFPLLDLREYLDLVVPALGIVLVVFADAVLTARAYAARGGDYPIDANRELLALGAANAGVGLFQGFAVGSSDSRTAVNVASGGRTQVVSLLASACTVVFLLALTPLVHDLPQPTLAGVVILAAVTLLVPKDYVALFRFRRFEGWIAVATVVGVSVLGILPGILAAVGLTLLDLVHRLSRPARRTLGPVPGSRRWRTVAAGSHAQPDADDRPGLVVVRYGGPVVFANAEYVLDHAKGAARATTGAVRWLVIDAEAVTALDSNGAHALSRLARWCRHRGIELALARVSAELAADIARAEVPVDHVYERVADAVDAYDRAAAQAP
ncbi:sulphate transporter [Beutenbergia cavernae DSM 12333]|uniref:Sulphate transporter n=1 Tax=Beutenbergia cavernae (strain ATCC BAA-8 / DSM 12333 / CCUG 43141 / JCM 11478 / NBRC 16432 / NCIMB 13614 / HKI 0122) TaxID=471853 RepID=C5BYQ1_BEUC1|nr:SulP family inorganic anion transporter [Beutenbergia cavernae]ACQ79009.1 sulphate transporter [Beutenbergia cavernae DSM 12333]